MGGHKVALSKVVAYIELLPGSAATPTDPTEHAARLLAPYKRPSGIIVLDALPAGIVWPMRLEIRPQV